MDALKIIEEKIKGNVRLSKDDGLALLRCRDILWLGQQAAAVKKQKNGDRVFYNVNCHINLTNVCISRCHFCAFSRDETDSDAYVMDVQEVLRRLRAASSAGITEVHIVSGLHPTCPFSYYLDILRAVRHEFPSVHIKAFTPVEIHYFSKITGLTVQQVLEQLVAAGVQSLPGGGAEVLSDRVRQQLCPNKAGAREWLAIMETAHKMGLKSNATILFGHIETEEEVIDHLLAVRDLQDRTGGFQAFIPLVFHPANTKLSHLTKPTAFEQLRMIAVSRLMLDNIEHIKAYWVMTGLKIAQLALFFGADDIDGTVIEERITHAAGAQSERGVSQQQLTELIRQAGKIPVERDTLYTVLRAAH
ncbi:MAG: aminofutalosine synthase MqnE [Desulfobacterota bacterium]|nr:aminofutalosine synthase MqnE [Thermodesulfobacteriota bacterium]